ncbi:MAG: aminoacyl-tRNA hydrolase [Ruminococcaceae bacterium]|jgi:PTH1 family peptidyl-tRNA hydrolase|nr:aminoacyl-tRNA hydrolase [Oscillospiraceae bacterium]
MFNRFKKNTCSKTPEFLVVGLGNPDRKYALTRHNSGFLCVDEMAENYGFKVDRLKFKSLTARTEIAGRGVLVMKPSTYMNNSGLAVREAASFYKIKPENIIIIFDDVSLDIGKMRIRRKGTDGGHNGIKSIIYHLQSDNFPRVKIGVGKKPNPDYDLADWVLSRFTESEQKELLPVLQSASKAVELIIDGKIDEAMNKFNS